jgi:hypothetical protein
MIRLPQRSVTRFFIPLIDVLTLLFCIFLLLPLVESSEETGVSDRTADEERLRQLEQELAQSKGGGELAKELRDEIQRLRKEKGKALQERLAVRVLEIDPTTGRLYYRDPERVEISSQADARDLIDRDRRERGVKQKELFYLILYPRDRGVPYPTRGQREQYDRWFEGVALGYDIPGKGPQDQ